ncbi:hypothetical protein Y032_0004g1888 [Ancylostoma ceylanicum]|uniref:Uncharacterized protein n=1 Tax=Ancylostoma ceylanicum TaxID=53326 RepID=A0A016VUJ3_9BILA|nr:hypothetical protein Y032_0004g1888 [Ancylostoma ceylanicum]
MDNEGIQNLLIGVLIAKSVKDTPREEYMNSEMDPSKYDPTVEFVQYIMDKADAASPRVFLGVDHSGTRGKISWLEAGSGKFGGCPIIMKCTVFSYKTPENLHVYSSG